MKYHDKVNLTSPIFKYNNSTSSKKLTKSPLKATLNPSNLFQKVCCPNCKYLFKIIKQQMIKQSPQLQTPTNKSNKKQNKLTQTEGVLSVSNSNSPTRIAKNLPKFYNINDQNGFQNSNKSQFNRLNDILQMQNNQNNYVNDQTYKFKPLSLSPRVKKSKSSNSTLLKTLAAQKIPNNIKLAKNNQVLTKEKESEQNQYSDSIYMENTFSNKQSQNSLSTSKFNRKYSKGINPTQNDSAIKISTPKRLDQKIESNHASFIIQQPISNQSNSKINKSNNINNKYSNQPNSPISKNKSNYLKQSQLNQTNMRPQTTEKIHNAQNQRLIWTNKQQLQLILSQIILKDQQNTKTVKQFRDFCISVSEEVQLPSYCKMLAFSIDQ